MAEAPLPEINGDVPLVYILSLNCWGLKYISKHRAARLNEISLRIANAVPQYDIVALQEFWVYSDYLNLRQKTSAVLPYGKFYFSGAIGGGLVVLSKWPIEQSTMFRYPLNGRPTAFFRGDFYVGKGVACATIRHPSGRILDVFNTHLHAPYEKTDTYLCHRTAQAWEMAKLLRGAVQKNHVAIGLGDFNMIPSSLAHRIISTNGLVSDSWLSAYPDTPSIRPPNATAQHNIEVLGITCDSVLNTWRMPGPNIPPQDSVDPRAQRLDYVFHSPRNSSVRAIKVAMIDPMQIPSEGKGPGGVMSVSDHFSVDVVLALAPNEEQQNALNRGHSMDPQPMRTLIEVAGSARAQEADLVGQVGEKDETYLPQEVLNEILAVRKKYADREQKEYKWRIAHFWASIPVLVATHVGVWWSPHNGVSFMLVFVSWVIAVTGVMDGLIGFIFTGSELRALKEFEEEVVMYKKLAAASVSVKSGTSVSTFRGTDH